MGEPLVSCLMVTAGRMQLAERAVRCFCAQTWKQRELVIVDDGNDDYAPMLRRYSGTATIQYHRISPDPACRRFLGGLRNISLDCARGDYCAQWDDDDWYHPDRLEVQMGAIARGFDAAVLRHTLMHLDTAKYVEHPFRTGLRRGTPGTIVHRRSTLRYPDQRKREDTVYLDRLRKAQRVAILGPEFSHLFVRCFHGDNTWDRKHFSGRLHYSLRNKLDYLWARFVRHDVLTHPSFRLTAREAESARLFLAESRELGLVGRG